MTKGIFAAIFLVLTTSGLAAQSPARPITLSWDANPEPDVLGYIVHVGNVAGSPNEQHDVGSATAFVYEAALPAERYYFTVSAYTVSRIEGPQSEEVSVTAVSTATVASRNGQVAPRNGQAGLRFESAGSLSGLTALQDGRLLLIENDRSISLLAPGSSVTQPALHDSDPSTAFIEVAVNKRFPTTHHVFISVIKRQDDGTAEFSVVRYRELQGALGEGMAVVAGLRFGGTHMPRFAVDEDERIYVAMPATGSRRSDPYASNILRFNADGTVPEQNHAASPVWARGFSQPANLGWDGRDLLAIGADEAWSHTAARVNPDLPANVWPQTLDPLSLGSSTTLLTAAIGVGGTNTNRGIRAFIDASQRLFLLRPGSFEQKPTFEEIPLSPGFPPVAVAAGFDDQIYVIVHSAAGQSLLLEFGIGQ